MNTRQNKIGKIISCSMVITFALLILAQLYNVHSVKDTTTMLDNIQALSVDEAVSLSNKTLIVYAEKFDVENTQALKIEKICNNTYSITYDTEIEANVAYERYSNSANVAYCEFDSVLQTSSTSELDTSSLNEYNKSEDYNENRVVIAVIDSGATGYFERSYNAFDGSSVVTDTVGHGTQMISIIQERLIDGGYEGKYEIVPIKVANDNGVSSVSSLIKALNYVQNIGASVVNISLTSLDNSSSVILEEYINSISEQAEVVVSAGNYSSDATEYIPAKFESAFVVGSCDSTGLIQEFSNYGESVDNLIVSDSTSEAAAKATSLIAEAFITDKEIVDVMSSSGIVFNYSYTGNNEYSLSKIKNNWKELDDSELDDYFINNNISSIYSFLTGLSDEDLQFILTKDTLLLDDCQTMGDDSVIKYWQYVLNVWGQQYNDTILYQSTVRYYSALTGTSYIYFEDKATGNKAKYKFDYTINTNGTNDATNGAATFSCSRTLVSSESNVDSSYFISSIDYTKDSSGNSITKLQKTTADGVGSDGTYDSSAGVYRSVSYDAYVFRMKVNNPAYSYSATYEENTNGTRCNTRAYNWQCNGEFTHNKYIRTSAYTDWVTVQIHISNSGIRVENSDNKTVKISTLNYLISHATLNLAYNANGGKVNSSYYKISGADILKTDNTKYMHAFWYNLEMTGTLFNYTTFGLYRPGYDFGQWTNDGGTTIFNQDTTTYLPTSIRALTEAPVDSEETKSFNKTLTAVWTPSTYTLQYKSNGGTGSIANQTVTYGGGFKLASGFSRTGYTFKGYAILRESDANVYCTWTEDGVTKSGWKNVNNDDIGKDSANWKMFSIGTDCTMDTGWIRSDKGGGDTFILYAQWTPSTYTLQYKSNGGTGSIANQTVTYGNQFYLSTGFTRTGYTFKGYAVLRESDTKVYCGSEYDWRNVNTDDIGKDSTKWKMMSTSTHWTMDTGWVRSGKDGGDTFTFYAQWTPSTYTLKYNSNGGTGSIANQTVTYGNQFYLSTGFTRTGYKFKGYAVLRESDTQVYCGSTYGWRNINTDDIGKDSNNWKILSTSTLWTMDTGWVRSDKDGGDTFTFYAQWEPIEYTIDYDKGSNEVTGSIASQSVKYGESFTLAPGFYRTGYTFKGYAVLRNSDNNVYCSSVHEWRNLNTDDVGKNSANWNIYAIGYSSPINSYWVRSDYFESDKFTFYAQWTPNTYYIEYNKNKPSNASSEVSGSMSNSTHTYNTSQNLTTNSYSLTGWVFKGWKDSSGNTYTDGQSVTNLTATNGATVTLYAIWEPITYNIKYTKGSTNISGSNQTQSSLSYDSNVTLKGQIYTGRSYTVSFNTNKPKDFLGNYTTGTVSSIQSSFSGNLELSKWSIVGSTASGTYGYSATLTKPNFENTQGSTATATAVYADKELSGFSSPTLTGYQFNGYYTSASGGTKKESLTITSGISAYSTTLYAQWVPITYTIKYDANNKSTTPNNRYGDAFSTDPTGSTSETTCTYNAQITLRTSGFSRVGYKFKEWNTKADGTGTSYQPGAQSSVINLTATNGATVTLYAIWEPITYNIKYNSNDDSLGNWNTTDSYASGQIRYDQAVTLSSNKFSRTGPITLSSGQKVTEGYNFIGWSKNSSENVSNLLSVGQSVKNLTTVDNDTVNMYATWEKEIKLIFNLNSEIVNGKYTSSYNKNTTQEIVLTGKIYNSKYNYTFNLTGGKTSAVTNKNTQQENTIEAYGTVIANGENSSFVKTDSNGIIYRFLGWNDNSTDKVPSSTLDVFSDGSLKADKNSRVSTYTIYDSKSLYAIWEPTLNVTFSLNRTLGNISSSTESLTNTKLTSIRTSDGKQQISLVIRPGEQGEYRTIVKGSDTCKMQVTFDSRITDIYEQGDASSSWKDTLNEITAVDESELLDENQKSSLNRLISPVINSTSRKFYIPLYLGTTSSYDTSNPDISENTNEYQALFKIWQSSYYYETYKDTQEQVQIEATIYLLDSTQLEKDEAAKSTVEQLKVRLKILGD